MKERQTDSISHADSKLARLFTKGVMWTGSSSVIVSATRFAIIAVLARVLTPGDFGLFSLTLLVTDLGNDLGDLGIGPAIVQRQEISPGLLNTLFWTVLVGGFLMWGTASCLAPLLAWFFGETMLSKLIIVSSLSFVIRPGGLIHRALLQKNMLFHRIAIVEIGSTLLFGLVSIFMAIHGLGVWSLVYGLLAHRISDVFLCWCLYPYRPVFQFDRNESRETFRFARNVFGERITYFISSRMDYIIVGRVLGSTMLGYYTLASEVTSIPQKRISSIISTVAFPTFSYLQQSNESLRNAYMRVNKTLAVITFPFLGVLAVYAGEFTRIFYGTGWDPVILPMQILCLASAIKSIMQNNGTILYSKNRSDLAFRWGMLETDTHPCAIINWVTIRIDWAVYITFSDIHNVLSIHSKCNMYNIRSYFV